MTFLYGKIVTIYRTPIGKHKGSINTLLGFILYSVGINFMKKTMHFNTAIVGKGTFVSITPIQYFTTFNRLYFFAICIVSRPLISGTSVNFLS
jgi:hypothetical protein